MTNPPPWPVTKNISSLRFWRSLSVRDKGQYHNQYSFLIHLRFEYDPVETLYAIEILPRAIRAQVQGLNSLIHIAASFAHSHASRVTL